MTKIAPSILSANFANLGSDIRDVEKGGADWIHVDVMDGHFVPNMTIGPLVVEAIRPETTLPLDVHLMIENPDQYIPDFAKAGADIISVHQEACPHLHRTVNQIREAGAKAGVVINPGTPVEMLTEVLEDVDLILFMTVNPGFGGQSFISSVLSKIRTCRHILDERGSKDVHLQVDGGINEKTAQLCVEAGADVLVAGTYIFKQEDRARAIQQIKF